MTQTVLWYKTELPADQTDHVVCIFQPSAAPYFFLLSYFPFIVQLHKDTLPFLFLPILLGRSRHWYHCELHMCRARTESLMRMATVTKWGGA